MVLEDLEVYQIALEISNLAWEIYNELPREHRFNQGNQFLEAADSVGANIAEGFGRYHYRDSLKFYYNSRGSLLELKHWNTLFIQRTLAKSENLKKMSELTEKEHFKLNSFINSFKSRNLDN
jgi:four helix bundle protein